MVVGDGKLTVYFDSPADIGGYTIHQYALESDATPARWVFGASSPLVMHQLVNGAPYSFRVRAQNAIGNGTFSSWTAPVLPGSEISRACCS